MSFCRLQPTIMIIPLQKQHLLSRLKESILLNLRSKKLLTVPVLQLPRAPNYAVQRRQRLSGTTTTIRQYGRYHWDMSLSSPLVSDEATKEESGDSIFDRIFSVGKDAMRTRSVLVIQPTKRRHSKKQKLDENPSYRTVRVTTSSTLPINETRDFPSTEVRFNVKPLIILDLNGILCYRIRRQLKFADHDVNTIYPYRPQLGPDIAQTPIIPRPNVASFIEYLDQHFCLAIWTSARAKTANALIKILIPEPVRDRLLFVWSQSQCEASLQDPDSSIPSDVIFRKNLGIVWRKFPLWNTCNTLLIDDSPDKCIYYKENSIHPPSLNGRQVPPNRSFLHPKVQMSDDENVAKQLEFVQKLVQHWNNFSVVQTWDSRNNDFKFQTVDGEQNDIKSFLAQHAMEHMGYHTPT